MRRPGDRATRFITLEEPTQSQNAEGRDAAPNQAEVEQAFLPGSKSSACAEMSFARESGDLGGASASMVDARQSREGEEPQAVMKHSEESDEAIVPKKPAKTRVTPVESVEGRAEAKGKPSGRNTPSTQSESGVKTFLQRVGQRAKARKQERFTNLLSHVKVPLLKQAYQGLRKDAAPGVDEMTWEAYGEKLEERLAGLQARVHQGSYRPQPVLRVYIPKGNGGKRPLGIPALEDKIVQQAVRMVLEPIYEAEFVGFSYGFRPGRSPHGALDALAVAMERRVSWVLDADIRSFFDTIEHEWLRRFVEHRIGDRRLVRLLVKWLKAGVMEDGQQQAVTKGTPQGGIISPLLANIYLHYVLDLWAQKWRKEQARGDVYIVRYADDFAMGFQKEEDARAMREALAERLAKFGLELHTEKTRVLRFGRYALKDCRLDGRRKPETFDFLGFTHVSGTERSRGRFQLIRRTSGKKRRAKIASLQKEMVGRRHTPVAKQFIWLSSVLRGHYRYYGVPTNYAALERFFREVRVRWYRSLQRRSQRGRWGRGKYDAFDLRFPLPKPSIQHPWPSQRLVLR